MMLCGMASEVNKAIDAFPRLRHTPHYGEAKTIFTGAGLPKYMRSDTR